MTGIESVTKLCALLIAIILGLVIVTSAINARPRTAPAPEEVSTKETPLPTPETSALAVEAVSASPSPSPSPTLTPTPMPTPTPEPGVPVTVTAAVPLYAQPGPGDSLATLTPGQEALVLPTEDPLWFAATLADGTAGFLYGEALRPVDGGPSPYLAQINARVARLKERLPQDKYWNHMGDDSIPWGTETPWSVTDIPYDNYANGEAYCNFYRGATDREFGGDMDQCLGFASLLSDGIFGMDAPLHRYYNLEDLRVGDHIRLYEYEHSMTVVALDEEGVTVGECNENYQDCRISWDRRLTWDQLRNLDWDATYFTRYPLRPDGNGGWIPWQD